MDVEAKQPMQATDVIRPRKKPLRVPVGPSTTTKALVLRRVAETEIEVLLDTGAEVDVISTQLAKRLQLQPATDYVSPDLESFEGPAIQRREAYWLTFFLLDNGGRPRKMRRVFASANLRQGGPDIILSRPSMGLEGIIIDTFHNTFTYSPVAEVELEMLLKDIVKNREKAYIIYITPVLLIEIVIDLLIFGEEIGEIGD